MALISDSVINLLQYRIVQEELSSRLYKSMAIWLNYNGYMGAAQLWSKYSDEELTHAQWAYNYLLELNIQPNVPALSNPQVTFKGLPNIIALSYKHEVTIKAQCDELAKTAQSEGDYMTLELAQRYLKEQVDELDKIQTWIDKLEAFGDDKTALRFLDNEMGELVK